MTERTQKNILPEGLLFGEANFEERMRKEVQPWLKNQVKEGYFRSWDGSRIHYLSAVHPGSGRRWCSPTASANFRENTMR